MRYLLKDILIPQPKSKIKAGEGKKEGEYKFFTSSIEQTKFIDIYNYDKEALIFGTGGNANVHYCDTLFSTSTDCIVMYTEKDIELKLIYYYLKNNIHLLEDGFKGAGIKHISKDYILNLSIDLPLKCEQKNILKVIENAENIILNRKQQLLKLDELVKSRFIKLFGNILCDNNLPLVELKELADIGSSKRIYANEYVESGVPFYRSKEIRELGTGLKPSVELFIKQERYEEIKAKYGVPKIGDILIAAIGATIGYSWIVDTDKPFYYKDGNLIILSIKNNVNPIFLNHTMGILIEDFKSKGAAGSAQLALTIEKLEKMMVINPSIDLQNQFATFVEQTDKSKLAIQKSLKQLETLKKSLMHQYFG